ncbi:hypothetical protein L1987_36579 [Smallanthus sonchifolius]|uniref:Uncharacterized protein n=1 Tax=Smallanthus sonchifolius TaxID=185202 RepID=A0ACB9HEM7_9ASTR|nr:hypothetical protein L1987_36579 [Smallanthus sonchifolius]
MDFQEAIRRSMDDVRQKKDIDASSAPEDCKDDKNTDTEDAVFVPGYLEKDRATPRISTMETSYQSDRIYHHDLVKAASDDQNSQGERCVELVNLTEENRVDLGDDSHEDNCREKAQILISSNNISCTPTNISNSCDVNLTNVQQRRQDDANRFVLNDLSDEQVEITKANLEEEMSNLTKERTDLSDEQRRLERNSESVSVSNPKFLSTKLPSCLIFIISIANLHLHGTSSSPSQELLQMFGLPYIIAPMEAEAQCA